MLNSSFETAGASAGLAQSWTKIVVASGGEVAIFAGAAGDPTSSVESFEGGWGNDTYATTISGGVLAVFDPTLFPQPTEETFALWVGTYQSTISGGTAATFFGSTTVEDFEVGWGNDTYATTISSGDTATDNLATGWVTPYLTAISGGTAATFSTPSGLVTTETFEAAQADRPFTVDLAASPPLLVCVGHDLDDDQRVTVVSTGRRPTPLAEDAQYFVDVVDVDHVRLTATSGGSPLVLTDVGTGKHRLRADPAIYWTGAEL